VIEDLKERKERDGKEELSYSNRFKELNVAHADVNA